MHGLDISFKDFVFERDSGSGRSLLRKKNPWPENSKSKQQKQSISNETMGQSRKLSVGLCRRKNLEWLSKFGKPLTPLEEETYNFGNDDEDYCQAGVGIENLSSKMTIEQEIPQFLPMMGRKVPV